MDGYNSIKYANDQNELSDFESITISIDASNPTIVEYDGYLFIQLPSPAKTFTYTINGKLFVGTNFASGVPASESNMMFCLNKGDTIYGSNSGNVSARWYKNRDYSNR